DVSPNVMIMYFISSLPISAPGTGALTRETEPGQHAGHGSPSGSPHRRNQMRLDLLEGVRTPQWSGHHSSHGIRHHGHPQLPRRKQAHGRAKAPVTVRSFDPRRTAPV